jgi:hypothetical protein
MAYRYDADAEIKYGEQLKRVRDLGIVGTLSAAIGGAKEQLPQDANPWIVARFIVSPADGIADYVYDNESQTRFRAPSVIIYVLIKYGDVVVLPSTIIRREKVIAELRRMLDEATRELQDIERKLRKRKSQILERLRDSWRSDIEKITRALKYMSST